MRRILLEDNLRKKIDNFLEYYLKSFLVIFALIILGIYILYETVFGYHHPALSVVIMSNHEANIEDIQFELESYLNVDYVEVTHMKENIDSKRILNTRFVSGDIDIFIAEKSIFQLYAQKDITEELKEYISDETYRILEENNLLVEENICEEKIDGTIVSTGESKINGVLLSEENDLILGIVKNENDKKIKIQAFDYFMKQ